jgi:S-DNA-T family DNA segregation ATPase FtsK/SpoIIIE
MAGFQLIMRSGPTPGKVFQLKNDEVFIGRDVGNDIVINDAEISRRHARLSVQAGGYILEDLGSTTVRQSTENA